MKGLERKIKALPNKPGVYKFFNDEGTLIYVGKAKNLKKRVSSYFNKQKNHDGKTRTLVSLIRDIAYTIVNSEFDAFLLENNLIKKHTPRYNIRLKDDKTFPYICVLDERFPRIISTRRKEKNNGTYYGPYANVKAMKAVMDLIQKLYTIRTCSYNLSEENINNKKYKVCLEYHLGNCLGPCEGLQTEDAYNQDIEHVHQILKGSVNWVKKQFEALMKEAAENMAFEHAQRYKEKMELIEKFQSKSLVVNPKLDDVDVFSIISEHKKAYVNYLKIKDGAIIHTYTVEVNKSLDESDKEILSFMVVDLRETYESKARLILSNIKLEIPFEEAQTVLPERGDKKKLVDLSIKNALYYKKEKQSISKKLHKNTALTSLQEKLHLKEVPVHIECFDNSNIQGSNPVASMVCFKNGKPNKKEYRHFNIKTVEGIDDFASMKEIVTRRYQRLKNENKPFPNLIVIDGGKGQLSAAKEALEEIGVYGKIPIIGIAKKLEEIYTPNDSLPLHIDKRSEALKLLQQLRNEAHRFAITFHRDQRSKASINSKLGAISGIGAKTEQKLLTHFKSLKKIKEASISDIETVVGKEKARIVKNALSE